MNPCKRDTLEVLDPIHLLAGSAIQVTLPPTEMTQDYEGSWDPGSGHVSAPHLPGEDASATKKTIESNLVTWPTAPLTILESDSQKPFVVYSMWGR